MNVAKDLGPLWIKSESLGHGVVSSVGLKPLSTFTPISKMSSGVSGVFV